MVTLKKHQEIVLSADEITIILAHRDWLRDSSSNAESMALRRAAAKFGLGLWLYDQ